MNNIQKSGLPKETGLVMIVLENIMLFFNQIPKKKRTSVMIVFSHALAQRIKIALIVRAKLSHGLIKIHTEYTNTGKNTVGILSRFWTYVRNDIPYKESMPFSDENGDDYFIDIIGQTFEQKKLIVFVLNKILDTLNLLSLNYFKDSYLLSGELGNLKGQLLQKTHNNELDELMEFLINKKNILETFVKKN